MQRAQGEGSRERLLGCVWKILSFSESRTHHSNSQVIIRGLSASFARDSVARGQGFSTSALLTFGEDDFLSCWAQEKIK